MMSGGGSISKGLERADELLHEKRWTDAANLLVGLTGRFPNNFDVWAMLAEAYQQLKDYPGLWEAVLALLRLQPEEPDNWYNAVHVAMMSEMPFTALDYAREYLRRFPDNRRAKDIKSDLEILEKAIVGIRSSVTTDVNATDQDFMDLEQTTTAMSNNDYQLAEKL